MTTRELTDDVTWVPHSHAENGTHVHTSMYVVDAPDGSVLVDAGAYHDEAVRTRVDSLAPDGISTVLLTHTSYPHTRDVPTLHESGTRVVTAAGIPDEFGMSYGEMWKLGEATASTATVDGRRFEFVKSPLSDHVYSLWIYDHASGVLFTSEALGNYHAPDGRTELWDEPTAIDADRIEAFCRDRLPWMQYTDPTSIRDTLESRLEPYEVTWVAPSHGNPVSGACLSSYLEAFVSAAEAQADEWTPPEGTAGGTPTD